MDTYQQLCTTIDIDGLYDLIELKQVHASWMGAAQKNAELEGERRRRAADMRRGGRG